MKCSIYCQFPTERTMYILERDNWATVKTLLPLKCHKIKPIALSCSWSIFFITSYPLLLYNIFSCIVGPTNDWRTFKPFPFYDKRIMHFVVMNSNINNWQFSLYPMIWWYYIEAKCSIIGAVSLFRENVLQHTMAVTHVYHKIFFPNFLYSIEHWTRKGLIDFYWIVDLRNRVCFTQNQNIVKFKFSPTRHTSYARRLPLDEAYFA